MRKSLILCTALLLILNIGGCKDKDKTCKSGAFTVQPFLEKRHVFQCNNSEEFTYIFRKKEQIDSLNPTCFTTGSVAYPTDETNIVYILVGRASLHYRDTISVTQLQKDTCNKKLTYEVDMIQRDTTHWQFPGVMSMFCSVENIPADYEVEVKYKYVPIQ